MSPAEPRLTRRIAALTAAAGIATVATPASAFDFSEHRAITQLALERLLQANPSARPVLEALRWSVNHRQLPSRTEQQLADSGDGTEDVTLASTELNDDASCRGDALLYGSAVCFGAADIPALAGDHAGSPPLLKWRWFDVNPCTDGREQKSAACSAIAAAFQFSHEDQSPEEVVQAIPDRAKLLELVRKHDLKAGTRRAVSDTDIVEHDDDYADLAIRGHPHFRPALAPPSSSGVSARRTYFLGGNVADDRHKPSDHAYAWYADLHLGAMTLADAARRRALADGITLDSCATRSDPASACVVLSAAWLLELSAQHYLQDSVSAGHMVANATILENVSLNLTHDRYCADGVQAVVPERVAALSPSLARYVHRSVTIYGDHTLMEPMRGGMQRDVEPTLEWATALARLSLEDVLSAATTDGHAYLPRTFMEDGRTKNYMECDGDAERDEDEAFTWDCATAPALTTDAPLERERDLRKRVYRCLTTWWESPEPASARSEAIVRAWERGAFEPIQNVPIPRGDVTELPTTERFSGSSIDVRLRNVLALDPDVLWLPEFRVGATASLPRNRVPIGIGLFAHALASTDSDAPTLLGGGVSLKATAFELPLFAQVDFTCGAAVGAPPVTPTGYYGVTGIVGVETFQKERLAVSPVIGGGTTRLLGPFLTVGLDLAISPRD